MPRFLAYFGRFLASIGTLSCQVQEEMGDLQSSESQSRPFDQHRDDVRATNGDAVDPHELTKADSNWTISSAGNKVLMATLTYNSFSCYYQDRALPWRLGSTEVIAMDCHSTFYRLR